MNKELYTLPEFEMKLKVKGVPQVDRKQVKNSRDVYAVMKEIFDADSIEWVESFVMICLNRQNKVLGFYKVSQGGVAGTVADPKVIFQVALMANASAIIIGHNHPSGNRMPSHTDISQTKKIVEGGKMLEISVVEHLIITADGYYSFVDEGLI